MDARTGEHGVSLAPSRRTSFDWMAKPSGGGRERATSVDRTGVGRGALTLP
jgi:hypothetical protein